MTLKVLSEKNIYALNAKILTSSLRKISSEPINFESNYIILNVKISSVPMLGVKYFDA